MKSTGLILLLSFVASPAAVAEKPEWTGKDIAKTETMKDSDHTDHIHRERDKQEERDGKHQHIMDENQRQHKQEATSVEKKTKKELEKDQKEMHKSQKQAEDSANKSHDKQRSADYKESSKGSEQGQAQREEVRKKWWKFWE